jgi:hypothetical protein
MEVPLKEQSEGQPRGVSIAISASRSSLTTVAEGPITFVLLTASLSS